MYARINLSKKILYLILLNLVFYFQDEDYVSGFGVDSGAPVGGGIVPVGGSLAAGYSGPGYATDIYGQAVCTIFFFNFNDKYTNWL